MHSPALTSRASCLAAGMVPRHDDKLGKAFVQYIPLITHTF